MRQVADRLLWLGNAGDLRNVRAVLAADISAVVELADSDWPAALPRDLTHCRFPLSDGGDNPPWLLRLAAESVATFLRSDVAVLVACSAGMSRSVCVAAGGLALADERSFSQALLAVVGAGPADVAPGLYLQMQQALGV